LERRPHLSRPATGPIACRSPRRPARRETRDGGRRAGGDRPGAGPGPGPRQQPKRGRAPRATAVCTPCGVRSGGVATAHWPAGPESPPGVERRHLRDRQTVAARGHADGGSRRRAGSYPRGAPSKTWGRACRDRSARPCDDARTVVPGAARLVRATAGRSAREYGPDNALRPLKKRRYGCRGPSPHPCQAPDQVRVVQAPGPVLIGGRASGRYAHRCEGPEIVTGQTPLGLSAPPGRHPSPRPWEACPGPHRLCTCWGRFAARGGPPVAIHPEHQYAAWHAVPARICGMRSPHPGGGRPACDCWVPWGARGRAPR